MYRIVAPHHTVAELTIQDVCVWLGHVWLLLLRIMPKKTNAPNEKKTFALYFDVKPLFSCTKTSILVGETTGWFFSTAAALTNRHWSEFRVTPTKGQLHTVLYAPSSKHIASSSMYKIFRPLRTHYTASIYTTADLPLITTSPAERTIIVREATILSAQKSVETLGETTAKEAWAKEWMALLGRPCALSINWPKSSLKPNYLTTCRVENVSRHIGVSLLALSMVIL